MNNRFKAFSAWHAVGAQLTLAVSRSLPCVNQQHQKTAETQMENKIIY